MNQRILAKVLATMLVLTMTLANIALLGSEVFALNTNLEAQNTSINNVNVNFDAYFKDEKGNKIHTITNKLDTQTNLYLYVKVEEGYLKETNIKLNNPNFTLISDGIHYDEIENVNSETNTITLNKIRKGEEIELTIPVKVTTSSEVSIDMFNKETEVTLSGMLVKDNSKTTKIEKTIKVNAKWQADAEAYLEQGVIKYVPYEQGEEKGIVLQTKIKTGILNNTLPIQKTNIQTIIPKINSISPKKIYVTVDTLKATNGSDGSNFTTSNWNKDNNLINIEVVNSVNNGKVAWNKNSIDEYVLTFIYDEEAYESIKGNVALTSLETILNITAYNLDTTKISKESKIDGELKEKLNDVVMFNVTTEESINKGYMYAGYETTYAELFTIDVANEELVDSVEVKSNGNSFVVEDKEFVANTEYKSTKINKDNFAKMLGTDGYINIYNQNNEKIATINKDSEIVDNNYVVNYDTKITLVKIETSKPKTVGKIKVENVKAILPTDAKTYTTLKTEITGTASYKEEKILTVEKESISNLVEPTTQVETLISNNTLSTIVENQNVEIRTILKSSDITCKLFNNPVITIKLPDYVENVSFNDTIKVLFTDELQIDTASYNPDTKTIEVKLKGEQQIFNDVSVANGPTIVLNTNITLNQLTPSKEDEIITTVVNGEDAVQVKSIVNYIAPIGMVTVNTISGYNGEETATSVSGQETTGRIDTNTNAKTAIVTLTLINNNNNVCKNIQILGRTPFEGNKAIVTGEDLGSTFTATLVNRISAVAGIDNSNILVYYSTNENATKDLTDSANSWTTEPTDLASIRSYLIVVNNYEMATGEMLSFNYTTQIPEGLRNDEKTFGTFVVYYDNVIAKEPVATLPEVDNNNTVVENTIDNTIVNNVITNTIIENTTVQNTVIENNTTTVTNTIETSPITTPVVQEPVVPAQPVYNEILVPEQTQAPIVGVSTEEAPDVRVTLETDLEDSTFVREGQVINYTASVVNMGDDVLNNVTLKIPRPAGTTFREYVPGTSYSKDEIVEKDYLERTILINDLEPNKAVQAIVQVIVNEQKENDSIEAKAIVSMEGYNDIESETITSYITSGILNIDLFTYQNQDVLYKNGDEVKYRAYVHNIKESTDAKNVVITCTIPNELEYLDAEFDDPYDNDYNTVSYNQETKVVKWQINKITPLAYKGLILKCKINTDKMEFTNKMGAVCSQSTEIANSNNVTRYIETVDLSVSHSSDVNTEYVDVGDKINYYIDIKNTGTAEATDISIIDTLSSGFKDVTVSYKNDKVEENNIKCENKEITLSGFSLAPNEILRVTVSATVSELDSSAKGTITLKNSVKVSANYLAEITARDITHKIKVKEQPKEDGEKKLSVSGIAWVDSSRDGIRDDNEELLKNIEVTLITKADAKVVKTVKTDKKGEYTFDNVEKGEYLVVFKFDTTKYEITKYQVEGANEGKNSDAALQQVVTLGNGKTIDGAVTNTIKVENANIYNIDLGLLESMKFDLSLSKTITKITKQDDNGPKTYDYSKNGKTLAKVEIPSKQVNKTTVIIEYTLTVKNEGNIPGYAKNIVDYLPKDLKFASELNSDWYMSSDGNLYNKSLADTIINPGETKEVKLLVMKVTNESNLGTTNNSAEIAESYNDYGVADVDSTAGNKQAKEDDYGTADVLITINTGTVIMYTGLITSMIALVGVGAYMIKKKVLGEM